MNPQKEHDRLLRQHKFELVSERGHLKYNDPHGRVYVCAKTPSDHRAYLNQLSVLKRIVAAPVPSHIIVEEMRQRKELEQYIALHPAQKSGHGIGGAGKGKKSRGTGIFYEEKPDRTAEQIAVEEEYRQRAYANKQRKADEKYERREARRESEEWSRQLSHFRRRIRQVESDCLAALKFALAFRELGRVREAGAMMRRDERRMGQRAPLEQHREISAMMHHELFNETTAFFKKTFGKTTDELLDEAKEKGTYKVLTDFAGGCLFHAGRVPRYLLHQSDEMIALRRSLGMLHEEETKQNLRLLRIAVQYRKDWIGEVLAEELARLKGKETVESVKAA